MDGVQPKAALSSLLLLNPVRYGLACPAPVTRSFCLHASLGQSEDLKSTAHLMHLADAYHPLHRGCCMCATCGSVQEGRGVHVAGIRSTNAQAVSRLTHHLWWTTSFCNLFRQFRMLACIRHGKSSM